LHGKGYSVIRSAGSGLNSLSPDILAFKKGKGVAFECKAWDRDNLSIENDRFKGLTDWQSNTSMDTFIAWRMNGTGWYFVKLEEMKSNNKTASISKKTVCEINRRIESVLF